MTLAVHGTSLWKKCLAVQVDDPYMKQRERLRVAYESIRERTKPLAEAIAKDLPDYTVHDISHSDALWEYADLIVGPNYALTPCEAFVLGAVFLIHDLGMGLAAYPEGLSGLKKLELWQDTVTSLLRLGAGHQINDIKLAEVPESIERQAISQVLRRLHAERAESLASVSWRSVDGKQDIHLIEEPDLREGFGHIIGRIASSHSWPVEQLRTEFPTIMGSSVGFPRSWTVDPLKLASILRCADYCHIDNRRAPSFRCVLQSPTQESQNHWTFQSKLNQPLLNSDRLVYTAKATFEIDNASAWWVCFDTLHAIDSELRRVDSLLTDMNRERFAARGVSQAEEPSRLSQLIKTNGWKPVDTRIQVSAVADLVAKLGGQQLYGNNARAPLRELIQNSADAVRARRLMDPLSANWGEIRVTSGSDDSGLWIQVEDTGVGMSESVLAGPFLDFGKSFWNSDLMHEQLPGLAARGFQSTGQYGIGFFSVFMWGERVKVSSQKFDQGRNSTLVLSFGNGLKERPILRKAAPDEYIHEGGTRIKIWLSDETILERLYSQYEKGRRCTLAQICAQIAPCLDVTIISEGKNGLEKAVEANDWLSISSDKLLSRFSFPFIPDHDADEGKLPQLHVLKTSDGYPLGRAAIWRRRGWAGDGIVTVGGFSTTGLFGITGVLVGSSDRASRDSAVPIIPLPQLREWVKSELQARIQEGHSADALYWCAEYVEKLGVNPEGLPVAKSATGWMSPEEIEEFAKSRGEVCLVSDFDVEMAGGKSSEVTLDTGVLALNMTTGSTLITSFTHRGWPERPEVEDIENSKSFLLSTPARSTVRAIANAWGYSLEEAAKMDSFGFGEERQIGFLSGKPFVSDVWVFRNPRLQD